MYAIFVENNGTVMAKFINPFTDVGFKRIFGQEINKDLIIDFLNSLLVGEKHIMDIRFLDKELLPEFDSDRGVIYDIYCINEDGERFIVEMQNRKQTNFRDRALYYLSQAISRQGDKGAEWRFDVKAVYGVFLMNFHLDLDGYRIRTDVDMIVRQTGKMYSDKLRMIFIELPSFLKEEDECENDFERWIYVLKNMETLNRLPFKARKAVFEKLEQIVDIASMTMEERMKYDASINAYRTHLAVMDYERTEGREEGRREGREEGRKEGREEGRKEGMDIEKRQIASNMKQMGLPAGVIAKATGLGEEEIANL